MSLEDFDVPLPLASPVRRRQLLAVLRLATEDAKVDLAGWDRRTVRGGEATGRRGHVLDRREVVELASGPKVDSLDLDLFRSGALIRVGLDDRTVRRKGGRIERNGRDLRDRASVRGSSVDLGDGGRGGAVHLTRRRGRRQRHESREVGVLTRRTAIQTQALDTAVYVPASSVSVTVPKEGSLGTQATHLGGYQGGRESMPSPAERVGKSAVGAVPAWSSPGSESSSGRHSSGTPARCDEKVSSVPVDIPRDSEMGHTYLRGIDPVELGRVGEVADKVQGVDVDPLEVARLGTAMRKPRSVESSLPSLSFAA